MVEVTFDLVIARDIVSDGCETEGYGTRVRVGVRVSVRVDSVASTLVSFLLCLTFLPR
jgi:hypothetical protein